MDVPLHADLLLLAQCRGRLLPKLTRQSLKRGVFRSVDELESATTRYIAATNRNPTPFVWTATAKTIQAKLTLNHPSEVSALTCASMGRHRVRRSLPATELYFASNIYRVTKLRLYHWANRNIRHFGRAGEAESVDDDRRHVIGL